MILLCCTRKPRAAATATAMMMMMLCWCFVWWALLLGAVVVCEASSHNSNNNNNILRGRARNNNNNNDDKPLLPRPLTHHQDDDAVVASRFYPAHLARVSLVLLSPRPRGLLALDALPPTATTNTSVDNTTTMTTSSSSSCQDYVALGFDCGDTCHDASNNTTSSSSSSFQCRYSNNIKEEDEEVWVEQHDTVVVVAQQPEEETENATNTSTSTTTTTSTTKITTTTTITTFQSVTSCQQATPTTTTTTAATSSSSHIICSTTHSNETLQEQGSSPLFLQAAGIGRTYTCELRLQNQLCHTCEMSVCGEGGEEGASSSSTMMQIAQFDCTNIQDGRQGNLCWGDAITITAEEEEEEESSSIVEEEDGRSEEDTLIVPTATSVAPVPTATTATTSAAAPTTTYVMAPPVAVVGPTYTSPVIISSSSTEEAKAETAPTATTTTTGTATTTNMTVTVTPVNASAVPVLDETTAPVAVDTAAPVTVDTAAPVAEGDATSTTAPAFDTMAPQVGDATSTTAPEVDTMAPEAGDATSTSAPVSLTLAPIDRTDDQPSVPIPVHPFQELCQFYDKHALGCKCPNRPNEQVPVDVSSMDCVKTQSSCSIDPSTSLQVCLNETVDFDTSSENGGGVSSFQVQSCYHVSTVPPTSYCILKTVTVPPAMLVNKENDQSLPPPLPPIMVPPAPVGGTSCQLQVNDQVCESCVYGRCPGQQTSEEDSIVAFDCTNTDVKTIGSECQGSVVFPLLATVTLPSILSSQEDGTVVATPPTLEPQFQSGSLTSPPVGVVGTEAPTLIDATWEPTQLSAITWAPTMVDTVDDVRGRTSAAGGAADVSGLLQEGQEMVDVSVSSSMEESSAKPTRNRSNYLIVSSFAMMVVVSAWLW